MQNIVSFPELYESATAFHRELSTLYPISTIFTTNWDTFFEQECGATPFVTAQDYALADAAERKVYKLHGSINNLGSVVITEDDYARSKRRLQSGVLGSTLVHTLATKTVIFVGYSFRDHDFQPIWNLVKRELGRHARHCYVVTLDLESAGFFKNNQVSVICTDCTYFMKVVKQRLVENRMLIKDSVFDDFSLLLGRAEHLHDKLHEKVSYQRHPETVHCASYQDGLIHAFERIISQAKTGQYSNPVRVSQTANAYEDFRRKYVRQRRYSDAAYVEGYQNGLMCLLVNREQRLRVPMFFLHGLKGDVRSFSAYKRLRNDAPFLHKAAHKEAIKLSRLYAGSSGNLVVHHIPRL